jgi:hypothetical protein
VEVEVNAEVETEVVDDAGQPGLDHAAAAADVDVLLVLAAGVDVDDAVA